MRHRLHLLHNAKISIYVQFHAFSSEDISGAYSVFEEEPKEHLVLHLTFGFPERPKDRMYHTMSSECLVSFGREENCIAPSSAGPMFSSAPRRTGRKGPLDY
jgi:hypothetical protein